MLAHHRRSFQLIAATVCAFSWFAWPSAATAQTAVSCPSGIGAGATCSCSGGTLTIVEPPNPVFTENNSSACLVPTQTQSLVPGQPDNGLAEQLERDLRNLARDRVADEFARGLDEQGILDLVLDDELNEEINNAEANDEDKSRLIAQYEEEIAQLRLDISELEDLIKGYQASLAAIPTAIADLKEQRADARGDLYRLQEDKRNAEQATADAQKAVDAFSFNDDFDEARRAYEKARSDVARWQTITSNWGNQTHANAMYVANNGVTRTSAQNALSAAELRFQLAEQDYRAAEAEHQDAVEQLGRLQAAAVEAQGQVSAIETSLSDTNETIAAIDAKIASQEAKATTLSSQISQAKVGIARAQEQISHFRSLIAALRAENQFSGPSAGPFDALRARGIDVFARTGFAKTNDTQLGRRVTTDNYTATLGAQARLSERFLAGIAVNYAYTDSDDRTGVGISSESHTYGVAPYAAYLLSEGLAASGSLYYGYTDNDTNRAGIATAEYGSHTYGAALSLSGQRNLSRWITLTGGMRQSFYHSTNGGYTDSVGLSVSDSSSNTANSSLSGRMDVFPADGWRVFTSTNIKYAAIRLPNGLDRLDASVTGGVEHRWKSVSLLAQVDHLAFRNDLESTGVSLQLRVPW